MYPKGTLKFMKQKLMELKIERVTMIVGYFNISVTDRTSKQQTILDIEKERNQNWIEKTYRILSINLT